jgi:phospholipase/carboxylesterase
MAELERAMQTGVPRDFAQKKPAEFLTALERLREEMLTLQQQYEDVIVGGFSQGAMMATHLANQLPLAGLVILSGTLLARELLMETHHHRTVPFFQSHGDQDQLLSLSQARALNELLQEKGWPGVWAPFRGGHEIPRQVLDSLQHFLKQFT